MVGVTVTGLRQLKPFTTYPWNVEFPPSNTSHFAGHQQTETVAPGAYADLNVHPDGVPELRSGVHTMNALVAESDSTVRLDFTDGSCPSGSLDPGHPGCIHVGSPEGQVLVNERRPLTDDRNRGRLTSTKSGTVSASSGPFRASRRPWFYPGLHAVRRAERSGSTIDPPIASARASRREPPAISAKVCHLAQPWFPALGAKVCARPPP